MSLTEDLLDIQKNIPELPKSGVNPHFKNSYVPLDVLMEKLLPMLQAKGILLLQPLTSLDSRPAITTMLVKGEESMSWTTPLVLGKDDPQGQGSAITYLRRYSLFSLLGLVGEDDDDGNAGMVKSLPKARKQAKETSGATTSAPPF